MKCLCVIVCVVLFGCRGPQQESSYIPMHDSIKVQIKFALYVGWVVFRDTISELRYLSSKGGSNLNNLSQEEILRFKLLIERGEAILELIVPNEKELMTVVSKQEIETSKKELVIIKGLLPENGSVGE